MSWFYLALLAPFLYAITNFFDDNLLRFVYKSPYLAVTFSGAFGMLPLLSLLFLPHQTIAPHLLLLTVLAGAITIGYYFFYFKGLESDTPSVVVALLSLAPVMLPFLAYFLLHERLGTGEIAGFGLVLVASLALTVLDIKQFRFSKALLPAALAAVGIAVASLLTKYTYERAAFYPAYMGYSAGMGIGGLLFFGLNYTDNRANLRTIRGSIKKLLPIFILAEGINLVAEFTLNLAISRGPVSIVRVMEGMQPIYVLLITLALYPLSPKYFREAEAGQHLKKFALMAVCIAGLVVVSLSAR